jgi:hypothetical protein
MAFTIFMTCVSHRKPSARLGMPIQKRWHRDPHLFVLPFTRHKPPLWLWLPTQRHDHLLALASEPLHGRLVWIKVCIRVFCILESPDNVELLVGKLDLFLKKLVLGGGPGDGTLSSSLAQEQNAGRVGTYHESGSSTVAKNLSSSSPLAGLMIFFPSTVYPM